MYIIYMNICKLYRYTLTLQHTNSAKSFAKYVGRPSYGNLLLLENATWVYMHRLAKPDPSDGTHSIRIRCLSKLLFCATTHFPLQFNNFIFCSTFRKNCPTETTVLVMIVAEGPHEGEGRCGVT